LKQILGSQKADDIIEELRVVEHFLPARYLVLAGWSNTNGIGRMLVTEGRDCPTTIMMFGSAGHL